jgi:hypothetical protein
MTKKPAKRSRKKKQIYSGALAEPGHSRFRWPIEGRMGDIETFFGIKTGEEVAANNARTMRSEAENLVLLSEHYGIDEGHEDGWCLLAFALARDHVPAFRPPPTRGRPKRDIDKLAVYNAVQKKMREKKRISEDRAITFVQKSEFPNTPQKTVAGWYYEVAKFINLQTEELENLKDQGPL